MNSKMNHLDKLRYPYRMKSVERSNRVKERRESSAEHTWSCLVLADYFLGKVKQKLDREKVHIMLLYHDLVEIEVGDVNLIDDAGRKDKKEKELAAAEVISQKLPSGLGKKYLLLFQEFEECKTLEAKFCKAIDALDAELHELDYKEDWKGWTEELLRKKKGSLFEEFPEMKALFEESLEFAREEGYFG
ncbi:MAG: HD domain-containing protein [Nanoarchaeota archaeon]